ncbi:protein of unknown function [Natronoarchaeum philippinense]|uniref:Protein-glutamine gamma-glutamyltransferase-like C-terminal domain-containing protein n=1 Tax=Natronoarchaeum philippinense TaxID=558529 RepID=A0A285N7T3_NATPI|nr:DUF4129 domain-containing protein [Natronoarchaeum philippinense]SNZ04973.1 protein of unknown function [Natronoarchaeum philippinense]
MQSNSLGPALVAGLCIAALGLGAATLSSAVVVPSNPAAVPGGSIDLPWPTSASYAAMAVLTGLLVLAVYTFDGRGISDKRQFVRAIPVLVVIVALIIVVNHVWLTSLQPPSGFDISAANGSSGGSGGGGAASNNSSGDSGGPVGDGNLFATAGLVAALLIGLLAVAGAEYIPDGDDDQQSRRESAADADDADAAAIGEAAGRAADRIEATDDGFENEVYRAWREMADGVDVGSPRTSTPAEFAAAAADAGLDPDRVEELTDLFEAVRYGDRAVTEERERRAVEALRGIEREQGGDEQ